MIDKTHPYGYEPGAPIKLYKGEATIGNKDVEAKGNLLIEQRLNPAELYWECTGHEIGKVNFGDVEIRFDHTINGYAYRKGGSTIAGNIPNCAEIGGNHDLRKVIFFLPGFPINLDLQLEWGEFKIELGCNSAFKESIGSRFEVDMSGIGSVTKKDGGVFKKNAVVSIIDGLNHFLSIAFNEWCPPMLIVGSSDKCAKSWELWRDEPATMHRASKGWFDEFQDPKQLISAFCGFMRLWHESDWAQHLDQIMTYVIQASGSMDTNCSAVAISQIPIELLTSLIVFGDEGILDKEQFKDDCKALSTAGKFSLMIGVCGIPSEVPGELKNLTALGSALKIQKAPKLLVEIRNSIIHPKKNIAKACDKVGLDINAIWWEASVLYWWYTNLILLWKMGYTGEYAKRLSRYPLVDKIERVPWANAKS